MLVTPEELKQWYGFYDMNDEYKTVWYWMEEQKMFPSKPECDDLSYIERSRQCVLRVISTVFLIFLLNLCPLY